MSNIIDFTKTGGYRFKQFTLRKMQEAYFEILSAFVTFCNLPTTGNYIISGCEVIGANITDGWMYIDGELCKFSQTAGTSATKVIKNVVTQTLGFKNGSNETVFRFVNAQVDAAGVVLSSFTRVPVVFDANYNHTDNNFTAALLTKLNGIEDGAEVNVQADWNVINPLSDAFINNKPVVPNILKSDSVIMGDFPNGTDEIRTISFPDVGTSNYIVFISPVSTGGSWNFDNDTTYVVKNKTNTSFDIAAHELYPAIQSITIDYILIAF